MNEPELAGEKDSLDEKQLLGRAQQAFEKTKGSQRDVARALDLNRSSVSRALRNEGLKHAAVQARVVSILEKVPVQRRSTYEGKKVRHEWILVVDASPNNPDV